MIGQRYVRRIAERKCQVLRDHVNSHALPICMLPAYCEVQNTFGIGRQDDTTQDEEVGEIRMRTW